MEIIWETYTSVNDFDSSVWDKRIALNNPFLNSRFMNVVEKTHPEDYFYYFIGKNRDEEIIAVNFYYVCKLDLLLKYAENRLIKNIRKYFSSFMKIPIGMTATWETYGDHSWFDSTKISYETLSVQFLKKIKAVCKNHLIVVWRDYLGNVDNTNAFNQNSRLGFITTETVSISKIFLSPEITKKSYLYTIKKKHRVYIRKILNDRNNANLRVEIIEDYLPLLDSTLYPLYSNVHNNAKEYLTKRLPKSFFKDVKEAWGKDSEIITVKDAEDTVLAFVLLLKERNTLNPFLIGLDYSKREYNLWYHCTWETILYAIEKKISEIDLGATNYSMKQKLGAEKIRNMISLRFKNNLLNLLFNKLLIHFA